jgi:hypothetical protein
MFISNNFEDEIFKPQDSLRFWEKLTGPKQLLLNQGIHASAELGGLIDFKDNFVWQQALLWMEYYLKGAGPKPVGSGTVTWQLRNNKTDRIVTSEWPSTNVTTQSFFFFFPLDQDGTVLGAWKLLQAQERRMSRLASEKTLP